MAGRRRALTLSLLAFALLFVIAGVVPARAAVAITEDAFGVQSVDLTTVPRVSLGLTNQGVMGAVCSSGFLSFLKMVGAGFTTGVLQSGMDFRCQDAEGAVPISGGSLTAFGLNRSVVGVIGDEGIIGEILPNGHGVLALDFFGPESQFGVGVGFTALIAPRGNTTPFTQSNLAGTWRIKVLSGEQGPGGRTEVRSGRITFDAAGNVVSGSLTLFPFGGVQSIVEGSSVTLVSGNWFVGVVTTSDGERLRDVEVRALMAGDKNFIAGVSADIDVAVPAQGMFFMQREPTGIPYTMADLAGVWNVFSLQGSIGNSAVGGAFLGTLAFNASGHVTASTLSSSSGPLPAVVSSGFTVSPQGFINGGIDFADESSLAATATMSKEKDHIVGVNAFFDTEISTVGLFTMFKQGPLSVVQFSTGNYSAREGATATITVTRTGATTTAVTVDFLASDPVNGVLASGTLTIPAGVTSKTFMVTTVDNSVVDPDHVVTLSLSNPTNGATIGLRGRANLIVLNDDSSFVFSQPNYTVNENAGKATVTIRRSGGLAFPATVLFRAIPGSALAGKDFTPVSRNVSFARNVTTATVDVPIINNSILDGDRTVFLQLGSAPVGAPGPAPAALVAVDAVVPTATLTITDDDTPGVVKLSSAVYSGNEGTSVLVTILRVPKVAGQPLGGNVSVDYTTFSNGSAIGSIDGVGADYTVRSGTVTFTGTETLKIVSIPLTKDNIAEGPEFFFFNLSNPTNNATLGNPSIARININDIDRGGVVTLSASSYSVSEGAGNVSIIVKRTGGSAANASVVFTTSDGTAMAGSDYGAVSTTLVFGLNEMSKTVVIPIVQDNLAEGNELFTVALSDPQGGLRIGTPASAPVIIKDDEVVIQFSGKFKNGQPEVIRTGPLTANVSVDYFAASGTATLNVDFRLAPGTLVFPPGVSSRMVPISVIQDNIAEGPETFTITLLNPSPPAQLGPNFQQVFTIIDDDFGGTVSFANSSPTAVLGQAKPMVVRRAGGLGTVMTVGWSAIGGTAVPGVDFSPASGQFTFLANQSAQTVIVNIGDAPSSVGKTIVFGLTVPGGGSAKLGAGNISTLTIVGGNGSVVNGLEVVSQATDGTRGNGDSARPAVSFDGQFVAFISAASNLAPGAGEGAGVYVRDRKSGTTELISTAIEGSEDGDASAVAISGDGRWVAFVSTSSNLVGNDGNGLADVFVRDRVEGSTQRVSMPVAGGDADGASVDVAISGDGNVIVFSSMATNLAPGAGNTSNLYLFNRLTGTTTLIGPGRSPAVSADGDVVAFLADDLLRPGRQAYVFDRSTGPAALVELISESEAGAANGTFIGPPAITPDGRFVAFESDATNLAFPAGGHQIFVFDRVTRVFEIVSGPQGETVANGPSSDPSFSADGRFVAFVSAATNLVVGDTNGQPDVFVRDRATGLTRRINVLSTGTQANGPTDTAALSGSGTFAAFSTGATSLTGGDFNNAFDVLGVAVTIPPLPDADIAIANVVNVGAPALNASVTFTVTATNNGPGATSSVQVTDLLPAGYAFVSAAPSQGSYAAATGVWTVGGLAANASATLSLVAIVLPGGPYLTVATRTASSPNDPNAANDSASVGVTPQAVVLTTDGPLVGVGRTINGVVTIPAPAPAGFIVTFNSSPAGVVDVPPIVAFAPGATTAPFTVTGVAVGTTMLTGSAAGFASGTVSVTTTASVISLGNLANLGPGQNLSLPISLSVPAPTGGVTVNFASANASVATVTSSVFIAGGSQVPAANPQVTGVSVGSSGITASATGFAPDTRTANVVVNVSFSPSPFSVVVGTNKSITVTLSAPAPAGGFTFNLGTANASVATVASSVTVAAGQTSVQASVTGVVIASTTLQASGAGLTSSIATVNVTAPPPLTLVNQTVGKNLQVQTSVGLSGVPAPAGGLAVTLTSSNASAVRISPSGTVAGNGSVVANVSAGAGAFAFYVQALVDSGSATLTASAPGYQNASATITLAPSAFIINTPGSFGTTTLSGNTSIQITSARLTPGTLTFAQNQELRGGIGQVNVDVTATDQTGGPGVGSITTTPLTFNGGDVAQSTAFNPAVAGTSLIAVVTPAGFNTPANFRTITATVSAPAISLINQTIGKDLQQISSVSLQAAAPAGGVLVTLTSSDPSKVVLSPTQTSAGNGSITLAINGGQAAASYYTQALSDTGSVTLTAIASGFQNGSATVTLVPSALIINSPGNFGTTTLSGNTSIQITSARLNSGTLTFAQNQELRGGISPVSVDITATDQTGGPGVGSITTTPLTFNGGDVAQSTAFNPAVAGTSQIAVVTPAGFNTSATFRTITATVSVPVISLVNQTIGKDLQQISSVSLSAPAPAGGVLVTLTSSDPSKVVLSPSQTSAGNGSITLAINGGQAAASYYTQVLSDTGSVTLNAIAFAFQNGSATVTLVPSAFIINSPGNFATSTFSGNTSIQITSARLNPGTLTFAQNQELRAGVGQVNVDVTATDQTGGPGVGSITTTPLTFNGGDVQKFTAFNPAASGTSLIAVVTPAGFSTSANFRAITATVSAPSISIGDATVGSDLQTSVSVSLTAAPPSPITVTLTVGSTAVATIGRNQSSEGSNTVTFTNVTTTSVGSIFVQGRTFPGTTTITVQAPGYNDAVSQVTTTPSGFIINSPGDFTTNTAAGNTAIQIGAARLDPTTLNFVQLQQVRGGLSVMVPVTSSDTTVGTITTSPVMLGSGVAAANTQFDPTTAGTSQIVVGVPTGFDTPSNFRQVTATVNP